ncbi:MAG: MBL fold metallo-hydrolase [Ferruginibacter sp.]
MSLFTTSLNSGSNGNCYYIGNEKDAVLIDAGLTCRETEKRMKLLGLSMNKVRAIFISHEHTDHVKGVPAIAEKFSLPVYLSPGTLAACAYVSGCNTRILYANQPVVLGGLLITAFSKKHDAEDPHSFIVCGNEVTIGIFTDIGSACDNVINYFKQCNAAYLEANYDEDLLENGKYPYFLKNRIRGERGHLSNHQALAIFKDYRPSFLSHLFLAHLSKDNNCPEKARTLFETHCGQTKIVIASRYEAIPLYNITSAGKYVTSKHQTQPLQMSLF